MKRSHGKSSHTPQCSTRSFAQAYNLHLPQKGSPFWLPHPEQFGFSFLFRNLHVPQYVPQGGTSLPFIYSGLRYQQICVIIINLGLGLGIKLYPFSLSTCLPLRLSTTLSYLLSDTDTHRKENRQSVHLCCWYVLDNNLPVFFEVMLVSAR
jgi:hypothetical protein